jgi:hypothetical protein
MKKKEPINVEDCMKISMLIYAFERLIPIYEKCVDECIKVDANANEAVNILDIVSRKYNLEHGGCYASEKNLGIVTRHAIYRHYNAYYGVHGYLFRPIKDIILSDDYSKTLVLDNLNTRIVFMRDEIIYLQLLINQGYTHL